MPQKSLYPLFLFITLTLCSNFCSVLAQDQTLAPRPADSHDIKRVPVGSVKLHRLSSNRYCVVAVGPAYVSGWTIELRSLGPDNDTLNLEAVGWWKGGHNIIGHWEAFKDVELPANISKVKVQGANRIVEVSKDSAVDGTVSGGR